MYRACSNAIVGIMYMLMRVRNMTSETGEVRETYVCTKMMGMREERRTKCKMWMSPQTVANQYRSSGPTSSPGLGEPKSILPMKNLPAASSGIQNSSPPNIWSNGMAPSLGLLDPDGDANHRGLISSVLRGRGRSADNGSKEVPTHCTTSPLQDVTRKTSMSKATAFPCSTMTSLPILA